MEGMRRFKHGALALAQYALANRAQVRPQNARLPDCVLECAGPASSGDCGFLAACTFKLPAPLTQIWPFPLFCCLGCPRADVAPSGVAGTALAVASGSGAAHALLQ